MLSLKLLTDLKHLFRESLGRYWVKTPRFLTNKNTTWKRMANNKMAAIFRCEPDKAYLAFSFQVLSNYDKLTEIFTFKSRVQVKCN